MIQLEKAFSGIVMEGELSSTWTVPAELPYFDGHFPGMPVLPAVAMVDASTYVLQRALNREDLELKALTHARFLSPIEPRTSVRIVLQRSADDSWQVDWKDAFTDRLFAVLQVTV